ncbi:MAG: S9 family peptidase [Actinomycetota bacterium]
MLPVDINHLVWASSPALSPDGAQVAYVVHRVDEKANRYRSRIWLAAVDGSTRPRPISAGEHNDAAPVWSPDGAQLFFTTTRRTDDKGQTRSAIYALTTDGPGEAALLAEHPEPIIGVAVSPTSDRLAYAVRVRGEHYASDQIDRRPPRKIDRPFYRLNGLGVTLDRPSHIHTINLNDDAAPVDVTPGDAEFFAPAWGRDGTWLVATRTNTAERILGSDVARIDLDPLNDEAVTVITDGVGVWNNPVVGPDGTIACVGYEDSTVFPSNSHVAVLSADGTATWVTAQHDRDWCSFPVATAPTWTADGMVGIVADHGSVHLHQIDPAGGTTPLVTGNRWVLGWSVAAGTIAFVAEDSTRPSEIFVVVDGEERQLTHVADGFVRAANPQPAERFTAPAPGRDGLEVDAWIVRPPDFDPERTYPALINIHGGPFTQYGDYFYDEAQHQARAGFVVLYSNPRGGSGRDTDWGHAIRGKNLGGPGWGTVDYDDIMSVVDTALEQFPFIDADRIGVLGGSYGGYMTSWIIGHTNRFAAACSERAVNNLVTLDLTSDIAGVAGFWFDTTALGDHEEMMAMSPITYADEMDTPLLIIHSDEDTRCGFEQADQLYFTLRERDYDVDYYRFPGENHELSRSGSPIHRVQRADLILDFFRDRLNVEGSVDDASAAD